MLSNNRKVYLLVIMLVTVLVLHGAALATVFPPKQLKTIDEEAFAGDSDLKYFCVSDRVSTIGSRAFADSGLERIFVLGTIGSVAENAFDGCGHVDVFTKEADAQAVRSAFSSVAGDVEIVAVKALGLDHMDQATLENEGREYYMFTAPQSGTYSFYCLSDTETKAVLFDVESDIANDNGGFDGEDFLITSSLTAGQQVYLGVTNIGTEGTVSIGVIAGTMDPVCVLQSGENRISAVAGTTKMMRYRPTMGCECLFDITDAETCELLDADGNELQRYTCDETGNIAFSTRVDLGSDVYLKVGVGSNFEGSAIKININQNPDEASIGENAFGIYAGKETTVSFTAPKTREYAFRSTGDSDTYAVLFDEDMTEIDRDDNSGEDNNFMITCSLIAGSTVYLNLSDTSATAAYNMPVIVEVCPTQVSVGPNTLIEVDAEEPIMTSFTAIMARDYRFYSVGDLDTCATLYDADMRVISSDDDSGADQNFELTRSMEAGETVYLEVSSADEPADGRMQVRVDVVSIDMSIGENELSEVYPDESSLLSYTAEKSREYLFYTSGESDTYAVLYDEGMNEIATDDNSGVDQNFQLTQFLNAGDMVYLEVTTRTETEDDRLTVSLDVLPIVLSTGENELTEIDAGDATIASFTAEKTRDYVFYSVGTADTYATAYDAEMQEIASDDDSGEDGNFMLTLAVNAEETVYLDLGSKDDPTDHLLCVQVDIGPIDLEAGENVLPDIFVGDVTVAKLTAEETCVYTFYSVGSSDTCVVLCDENMKEFAWDDNSGDDKNFRLSYTMKSGETVYLKLMTLNETTGRDMTVYVESSPITLNEGSDNSVLIREGEPTRVRFTASQTRVYTFGSTGDNDTYVTMYDKAGNELGRDDDSGEESNFALTYTLKEDETVYLDLSYVDETVSDDMTVTVDSCPIALSVGKNSPVYVKAGCETMLSFTADKTREYTFYSTGKQDTYGTLYDSNMKIIDSNDDYESDVNFRVKGTLHAGETVYLKVSYMSRYVSGEITVVAESALLPLSIGENTLDLAPGEILKPEFTAMMTGTYTFDVADHENLTAQLFDANGDPLNSDDGDSNDMPVTLWLDAGTVVYPILQYNDRTMNDDIILNISIVAPVIHEGATYRALLIGQKSFSPVCTRNEGDVNMLAETLSGINGGTYQITKRIDLTKTEVESAITDTFADADDDDISLFFYASHGITAETDYGALKTYCGENIGTDEIAEWLARIPGKVIVLIGTCGSGAVIENGSSVETEQFDPDMFNEQIVEAFSSADPGINVTETQSVASNATVKPKRGEMRQEKFIVMTAAMGGESSWGSEVYKYNFFTKWVCDGIGRNQPQMIADTNHDSLLTMNELYTYVATKASKTYFDAAKTKQQHPMLWPEDCPFVLFIK